MAQADRRPTRRTTAEVDENDLQRPTLTERIAHIHLLWHQLKATKPRDAMHRELTRRIRSEADAYIEAVKNPSRPG